ncbi:hypothetical protein F5Y16DRAFT_86851 [Xylariaceae sp. FL0255]|nr:hypothetical protein F5Y16DRAFT_86851 [Xylariaceae sp. FL0255]
MSHVRVAMERSLQERSLRDAIVNLLGRSIVAAIGRRDIASEATSDISNVQTAFSSWDNCMKADYCKYPAFALIAIGGLILLSVVWCIVRCACCGLSCCCECCRCLKCCGECCGMCDPPGGRRNKYLDEPFVPPHHDQAYRSEAPMHSGFDPKPSVPQYAVFDSGDKKNGDALPAMPSWGNSDSKKVLIEEEEVEMKSLKKPEATPEPPHMTSPSPMSPGNISPYGPPRGITGTNGYMAAEHTAHDAYGSEQGHANHNGYDEFYNNRAQTAQYTQSNNMDQGYDAVGAVGLDSRSRQNAYQQEYQNGYDHETQRYPQNSHYPQSRNARPYNDQYARNPTPTSYNNNGYGRPPVNDGYGNARASPAPGNNPYSNPRASPAPSNAGYGNHRNYPAASTDAFGGARQSPAPGAEGYGNSRNSPAPRANYGGYGNPSRTGSPGAQAGYYGNNARRSPGPQAVYGGYTQRSRTQDDYSQQQQNHPAPRRQYSNDSQCARPTPQSQLSQSQSMPKSPLQNNSGFDFNSGYSRPGSGRNSPALGAAPAATKTHNGGPAYPGYRPYKPVQSTE